LNNLEYLKSWWYNIEILFRFQFEIGIHGIRYRLTILGLEIVFNIGLPYFHIPIPKFIHRLFDARGIFGKIGTYKVWEISSQSSECPILGIDAYISIHQPHPGLYIELSMLLVLLEIWLLDGRHWDDNDHTLKYPEEFNYDDE
jgi:hypothetical protein